MGFTHYYRFNSVPRGQASQFEAKYQLAIKNCNKIIQYYSKQFGGLSGYSAYSNAYGGIKFNGSERVGQCEWFILREHLNQNNVVNFCKTNRHPYDTVVTACLIILKHRLGTIIDVSSDGDFEDWSNGLILAQKVLGLKKIRIPISKREKTQYNTKLAEIPF